MSKGCRGFESTPPRHTVWIAEKFRQIAPTIARNGPNSAMHSVKPDRRKRPIRYLGAALQPFSLDGTKAVRFRLGLKANASRS
jgi:hypothetical protein